MKITKIKNGLNYFLRKILYYFDIHLKDLTHADYSRIFFIDSVYKKIENVDGNIVECGVGFGNSLILLSFLAKKEGKNRIVYGLDSFEGFPEPSEFDNSPRKPKKGDVWQKATLNRIKKKIKSDNIDNILLVKGFFENTTKDFNDKIALLHIDADLYESYKIVLENLYDRVCENGVIIFDEYNEDKWPGATRAIDEFFGEKNRFIKKDKYANKYFFVKNI